ncbi:MAG: hypothetical protein ACJAYU_003490 [Bradymonadia bacterium]|jgi:hypothetical protein
MTHVLQRLVLLGATALALVGCANATGTPDDTEDIGRPEVNPLRDSGSTDLGTVTPPCIGDDCDCEGGTELCNGLDDDCDGSVDEDFNFMSEPDNCGGCSLTCTPANAAGLCVEGICNISACNAGFGDCDGNDANGCETEIASTNGCTDCAASGGVDGAACGPCGSGAWACQPDGSTVCQGGAPAGEVNACGGCGSLDDIPGEPCGTCEMGAWACFDTLTLTCVGDRGADAYNSCGECVGSDVCEIGDTESRPAACADAAPESRICDASCRWGSWTCGDPAAVCTAGQVEDETQACGGCEEGEQTRTRTCAGDGSEWNPWSAWGSCRTEAECEPAASDDESQSCGSCAGGTQSRTRACDPASCDWGAWSPYGPCSEGGGECVAGDSDTDTRACACGGNETRTRTCGGGCSWGAWSRWSGCAGGECTPGATRAGACGSCSEQVCTASCGWTACQLRAGNSCDWNEGTNWRCCGARSWQFCLSSCQWTTDCAVCSGCGC